MSLQFQIKRWLLGASAVVLAGCVTTQKPQGPTPQQKRMAEFPGVEGGLPQTVRATVEKGALGEDYTYQLTYIALGRPNLVESSADAREIRWTYLNFYPSKQILPKIHVVLGRHTDLQRVFRSWNNYDAPSATRIANPFNLDMPPTSVPKIPSQRGIHTPMAEIPPMKLEVLFQNGALARIRINDRDSPLAAFENYGHIGR